MIKLFEMFAGFGGASFALKKAEIDFECVGYSEIDKFAIQCYNQNHGVLVDTYEEKDILLPHVNYGDCTKIYPEELPDFDLLTGGFPCQSFSVAGKGLGELDTRGTLFNEIIRIAEVKQPRFMLLENVKGLTNKKHQPTFQKILSELSRIGYLVYWKILNTKDYGIPQNRERIFFVCFRKDVENNFEFPQKEELKIFLKDILEDDVDEKYYLKEEQVNKLLPNQEAHIGDGINLEQPNSKTRRGRVQPQSIGTLQTNDQRGVLTNDFRIRKLTPKECFRLMGFLDDEIKLNGLSNTQRYKLAGNGWDINLVSKIFKNMFQKIYNTVTMTPTK